MLSFAVGVAAAQPKREVNREANMRFVQMDADRDGVISRQEWKGSAQSFRVHDWDGDGVLSQYEVRIGAKRAVRKDTPGTFEGWDREYEYTDWTEAGFQRLDRNRDGRVTRDEFPFARAGFNRADHNRDGSVSKAEFLGGEDQAEDDDREDSFSNLDVNRDNRVDRGEWHGTRARFDVLDGDNNEFLTPAEFVGSVDPPPDLFASVDSNRDGGIVSSEWHWDKASFDARDINRDGRITRDELAQTGGGATPAQSAAHKAGYTRGLTDGRTAGEQDRTRGWGWNLEGRDELERADLGYDTRMNARVEYQAGYRDGFRQGYRGGYERR
jgi:Ca2+-binding EF-hand superfamily protein